MRVPVPVVGGRWCGLRRLHMTLRQAARKLELPCSTCCLRPQLTCTAELSTRHLTATFPMVDWTAGVIAGCLFAAALQLPKVKIYVVF